MNIFKPVQSAATAMLIVAGALLNGWAAPPQPIQTGDVVQVAYTCRLGDGRVVATNNETLAQNNRIPKHRHIFVARKQYDSARLVAGSANPGQDFSNLPLPSLEAGIESELSVKLIGQPVKQNILVRISGRQHPPVQPASRFLKLARHKGRRPIRNTVPKKTYQQTFDKAPQIDDVTKINAALSLKVVAIEKDTVKLQIVAKPEVPVEMGDGLGFYHIQGDHYEMILEPYAGELVRSVSMVGRITDVDEHSYTIDFGQPFRNDPLQCEVFATPVQRPANFSKKEIN
jgi:FKBP-type peptidyl-prolyl cis-trans isomerase 2